MSRGPSSYSSSGLSWVILGLLFSHSFYIFSLFNWINNPTLTFLPIPSLNFYNTFFTVQFWSFSIKKLLFTNFTRSPQQKISVNDAIKTSSAFSLELTSNLDLKTINRVSGEAFRMALKEGYFFTGGNLSRIQVCTWESYKEKQLDSEVWSSGEGAMAGDSNL